ncbi:MAG TPA: SRPBCC family protein [Burkholderiales bacterium]|nr:SRPBCC family protein [Burkholderiales bacterium]
MLTATVLALTLTYGSAPLLAASIRVTAQRDGDTIDVNATAFLEADGATAWQVLTDYDHYAEFIPNLRVSHVVARHGPVVTVEQSGDAMFWMFRIPIAIRYQVTESPPNRLQSRATGGSLRALASSYVLTTTQSGMRLDYSGHIAPRFDLLGRIEQMAVRKNIEREFQALADEIERRSAVSAAHDSEPSPQTASTGTTAISGSH